jgi:hypothetical protein
MGSNPFDYRQHLIAHAHIDASLYMDMHILTVAYYGAPHDGADGIWDLIDMGSYGGGSCGWEPYMSQRARSGEA